ncbi:MAG: DUF4231 domain-containing protein [Ktedonobacterales bacterium]
MVTQTTTRLTLTDDDMPDLFTRADNGAKQSKNWNFGVVRTELIAISLAALAQVAGRQLAPTFTSASHLDIGEIHFLGIDYTARTLTNDVASYFLPAVVMLVAVIMLALRVWRRYDRRWRSQRAIAESTKELAWRFSMCALQADIEASAPLTDVQAIEAFSKELREYIKQSLPLHLKPPKPNVPEITQPMRDLRAASIAVQSDAYLNDRLKNQAKWYSNKSGVYQTWTTRLQIARFVAYGLGGVLILYHGFDINGLGIMTTIAGAFATWLAGNHYDDLSQSYSGMASQLSLFDAEANAILQSGSAGVAGPNVWPHLVNKVETLMNGEHESWRGLA